MLTEVGSTFCLPAIAIDNDFKPKKEKVLNVFMLRLDRKLQH